MTVSFELTENQQDLQRWLHGFAADVIRPAAAEYDGVFATTCDVLAKCASEPDSPFQSPLTVATVPSEPTWVTIATW